MADRKKEGKMEIQNFEYLENEKSFFNEIKSIFYSFWRAIICWKNKNLIKIADTSFNNNLNKSTKCDIASKLYCQFAHPSTDAIDLKFYNGNILLHLVNHASRLSSSKIIKSEKPKEIFDNIFEILMQIYRAPEKFLTDSGGEFSNSQFLEMHKTMNTKVKVTAAESSFSNGLAKRQHDCSKYAR